MARILIGNIKGPQGPQGIQGIQGPVGPQGPQGPLPPLINNFLATEAGVGALDAVAGATLKAQLDEVNGDLISLPMTGAVAATEEEVNNLFNSWSSGLSDNTWYRGIIYWNFSHSVLGGGNYYLEGHKTNTNYEWQSITKYKTASGATKFYRSKNNGTWNDWERDILASDLGIVIKNSGSVAAVKNSDVQIATITLPANHKYLVLAFTGTSISDSASVTSCSIKKISGTTNSEFGCGTSRTTMNSGGCVLWGIVDTATSCIYGVYGYGYSSAPDYNYTGDICAIQLS